MRFNPRVSGTYARMYVRAVGLECNAFAAPLGMILTHTRLAELAIFSRDVGE